METLIFVSLPGSEEKISSKQFHKAGVVPHLQAVVRETGVNAANFIMGINESVAIDELEHLTTLSRQLHGMGTRIALDKFGSGSTAFMNMRNLPVDIIKVSSTFIDNYTDPFSEHFLRLSAELAHLAGKEICISGVEEQEQLDLCKTLDVDLTQGFHLYMPAHAETLESLLW